MPKNNINKEDLLNYLCHELDSSQVKEIENVLQEDSNLRSQLEDLKQIRMLQAETMLPILNEPMSARTEALIDTLKDKKSFSITSLLKLSPIALIGWLGFASVGSIQLAGLFDTELTTNEGTMIAQLDTTSTAARDKIDTDNSNIKLRGLSDSSLDLEMSKNLYYLKIEKPINIEIEGIENKTFIITEVFKNNEDICMTIQMSSKLNIDQKDTQEICFSQN